MLVPKYEHRGTAAVRTPGGAAPSLRIRPESADTPFSNIRVTAMDTFFEKEVWDQQDWDTYFRNLAILRHRHRLNKGDFNKRIGIWNAYRRDLKRPGRGTILSICRAFGVSEIWLASPHAYDSDPELDMSAAAATLKPSLPIPETQEAAPSKATPSDLISIFNDEKRAIRAVANLAFIETADPARFDEILEKIYGIYDNLKLKAAR